MTNPPVFVASQCGHVDVLRKLKERGDCVDDPGANGVTPLMIASKYGHEDAVKWLLEQGAKVDALDNYGDTALRYAYYAFRWEVARILIAHGADGRSVGVIPPERNGYVRYAGRTDTPQRRYNNGATVNVRIRESVINFCLRPTDARIAEFVVRTLKCDLCDFATVDVRNLNTGSCAP
jgi:hypothetical protein